MDAAAIANNPPSPRSLLGLPREIRDLIYEHLLINCGPINLDPENHVYFGLEPIKLWCKCARSAQILATCRQIHAEARTILYEKNTFAARIGDGGLRLRPEARPSTAWETDPRMRAIRRFDLTIFVGCADDDRSTHDVAVAVCLSKVPEIQRLNISFQPWPEGARRDHRDFRMYFGEVQVLPEPSWFLKDILARLRNVRSLAFNGVELVWDGFRATTTPLEYEEHLRRLDRETEESASPDAWSGIRAEFGSFSEAFGWEIQPGGKRFCAGGPLGGDAQAP